ncbi:MAG TPA: TetR/AcrR family transcriptional regulator, partial [Solirubrobacteraceae bacterium]|nr:TetR/AcrR family transcriptional regulator [Solirubrobacteraceae bacterium]
MPYRATERTEARRMRTREQLLAAAARLMARGGFGAASIAAVAREAGVATGTVYRHFPSKAELFAEVFRRASQREVDAVRAAVSRGEPLGDRPAIVEGPTPFERLTAGVETFARRALRAPRLAYALLAEPADPAVEAERLLFRRAYAEGFAAVLEEGIADGHLPAQDVDLTAAALV